LPAVLDPVTKFLGVKDVIVSLQELELLPQGLLMNEASVEERFASGIACGSHDRITTGWHNAVEPPAVMQCRI